MQLADRRERVLKALRDKWTMVEGAHCASGVSVCRNLPEREMALSEADFAAVYHGTVYMYEVVTTKVGLRHALRHPLCGHINYLIFLKETYLEGEKIRVPSDLNKNIGVMLYEGSTNALRILRKANKMSVPDTQDRNAAAWVKAIKEKEAENEYEKDAPDQRSWSRHYGSAAPGHERGQVRPGYERTGSREGGNPGSGRRR